MSTDEDQKESERSGYKRVAHLFPESPVNRVPPGLRPGVNLHEGMRIIVASGVTNVVTPM